ncbi:hypothetical protein [Candidatus Methanoperedens nitratireducens]|uniref:DUF5658 domain-containing protein n=1 Tax=Candidatus Methanoperedens nitratireducens TaxID=1392998 RepID=A0A284VRC8_9EURY|nr:hypothetical protein [Candidatus Methanoperedens nitroreducens]SNQ61844.1 membrane hypothetical protein [Candidatus Methanoperedens nitroreducens]
MTENIHILYITAFITFGIGDGVTAAYMMSLLGAGIEANPAASYLFTTYGFNGIVFAKMWLTFVLLFAVFVLQLKSSTNMYWTMNGFLVALTSGGLMAVNANLTAVAGQIPQAPDEIIFIYMFLVLILTEAGSFADDHTVAAS